MLSRFRSLLIGGRRAGTLLCRHAFALGCAYGAAALVSATTVWLMMLVLSSIGWASRVLDIGPLLQDWAPPGINPLIMFAAAIFIVPLGTMAAALFLPPVMLFAYPLAVLIAGRVADRRKVVTIGAGLGALLAPAIMAIWTHLSTAPVYRTAIGQVFAEGVPLTLLPSMTAGATIGWIVAKLVGPQLPAVTKA